MCNSMLSNAITIIIIVRNKNVPRHFNAKSFQTLYMSLFRKLVFRKEKKKKNFPNNMRELCCKSAFSHNLQWLITIKGV